MPPTVPTTPGPEPRPMPSPGDLFHGPARRPGHPAPVALAAQQDELVAAVATLTPSVVRIVRTTERRRHRRLGEETAAGTGFVVDDRGHLVTNHHLVRGGGGIHVTFADGSTLPGELVGADPLTDIALLRVVRKGPAPVTFADSDRLRVGQFALAIGNSLGLPGSPSVSFGVVSAVGRPLPWASHVLEGLVQTDAAINPGNSGGPLADLSGQVIGVNTAIVPFAQGVGFAVPSNTIRYVIDALLEHGRVVRPWLGIQAVTRLDGDGALAHPVGVYVAEVVDHGPPASPGCNRETSSSGSDRTRSSSCTTFSSPSAGSRSAAPSTSTSAAARRSSRRSFGSSRRQRPRRRRRSRRTPGSPSSAGPRP